MCNQDKNKQERMIQTVIHTYPDFHRSTKHMHSLRPQGEQTVREFPTTINVVLIELSTFGFVRCMKQNEFPTFYSYNNLL